MRRNIPIPSPLPNPSTNNFFNLLNHWSAVLISSRTSSQTFSNETIFHHHDLHHPKLHHYHPYKIIERAHPTGTNFSQLIPAKADAIIRINFKDPAPGLDGETTYRSGYKEIFMLFSKADSKKISEKHFRQSPMR